MKAGSSNRFPWLHACRVAVLPVVVPLLVIMISAGCSNDRPPPPARNADSDRKAHEGVVDTPKAMQSSEPYRAKLSHGAELYVPTWFTAQRGRYDLIVHFHGIGKLQEGNLDRAKINAAVVSLNLGVGTDRYANAFREPGSFDALVTETKEEIARSGRAPNATVGRIALSAWSAGFVSVAKIMSEPANADKIDAVLLADGFFTSFTDVKKRTINTQSLERFVTLVDAANRNEKLFAITHTAIPTSNYPSVEETVAKLLELTSTPKTPSKLVGPRNMHETYVADRGSFHVKGYEGLTAGDHIKQIHAMGETIWPYLKTRWEQPPRDQAPAPVKDGVPAAPRP